MASEIGLRAMSGASAAMQANRREMRMDEYLDLFLAIRRRRSLSTSPKPPTVTRPKAAPTVEKVAGDQGSEGPALSQPAKAESPKPVPSARKRTKRPSTTCGRPRGFAAMAPERQREIASRGGRSAHRMGSAHRMTPDETRLGGQIGGQKVSQDREHMRTIGRKGGLNRGKSR